MLRVQKMRREKANATNKIIKTSNPKSLTYLREVNSASRGGFRRTKELLGVRVRYQVVGEAVYE